MRITGLVWDDIFKQHLAGVGGHPENPQRLDAMYQALIGEGLDKKVRTIPFRPARTEEILRIHQSSYMDYLATTVGQELSALDPDTWLTARTLEVSLAAAGGSIELVDRILDGELDNGFAIIRPPGHHAIDERGMGFCIFNNSALAAEHLLKVRGLERIAIIDFDVHHGNGTNYSFYNRKDVLYCSTHQSPFFPGTGRFDEIGNGEGVGHSVNIPMRPGMTNADLVLLYERGIMPIVQEYKPDMLLISVGYDIHRRDPIGSMQATTGGIARLCRIMRDYADRLCGGKLAFFLEGGYDLGAQANGVIATVKVLLGDDSPVDETRYELAGSAAQPLLERLKEFHAPYWTCLGETL